MSWLWAHAQFNFYISFLSGEMYYIALLLTVAKKRVCAAVAHKKSFITCKGSLIQKFLKVKIMRSIARHIELDGKHP